MLALAAGEFDDAEAAAERGNLLAAADGSPFGDGVYGLQMFAIRRAQGRLAEVAPVDAVAGQRAGRTADVAARAGRAVRRAGHARRGR